MDLGTGTSASSKMNLNTINNTLFSLTQITNQISVLNDRIYGAIPEETVPEKAVAEDPDVTLNYLMDKFSNYIPQYCDVISKFQIKFEFEFFSMATAKGPDDSDKMVAEPSRLDKCFSAIEMLHIARSQMESLTAHIRGTDVPDANTNDEIGRNIFCFLASCNELLINHRDSMQQMLRELSEILFLEAC